MPTFLVPLSRLISSGFSTEKPQACPPASLSDRPLPPFSYRPLPGWTKAKRRELQPAKRLAKPRRSGSLPG